MSIRAFSVLASLFFPLLLATASSAATFTVGTGTGCTHADLASAILAAASNPGSDSIRLLAGSSHQGQFVIFTSGLVLEGGYATCLSGSSTGRSTLLGDNSNRAVFLAAAGFTILRHLDITGGSVTGDGGGIYMQGSGPIQLNNVWIFGNSATGKGGNVYVSGSPGQNVHITGGSLISAGDALDGGGLACAGDGDIQLDFDTLVVNNAATGDGGGLHLSSLCTLVSHGSGSAGGILTNSAGSDGGGAYVESGAILAQTFDISNSDGLGRVDGNTAGARGGGVYVSGTGSRFHAGFSRVSGNQANEGGGIFANNGATVTMNRTAIEDLCLDKYRCSLLSDNSAATGGAIYADVLSQVTIEGTHLERNTASVAHPVASVRGGSLMTILSSVIARNDGQHPFFVNDGGSRLTLGNATVVENLNPGTGFLRFGPGANGNSRVMSSVFDQSGALFAPGAPAAAVPQVDCVMSRHAALLIGFPAGTTSRALSINDPELANPAAGNYMLKSSSPAIDYCDTNQWPAGQFDLDFNARDIDDPNHPNPLGGFRDLGADESLDIFSDGFESGDSSAWDAVTG